MIFLAFVAGDGVGAAVHHDIDQRHRAPPSAPARRGFRRWRRPAGLRLPRSGPTSAAQFVFQLGDAGQQLLALVVQCATRSARLRRAVARLSASERGGFFQAFQGLRRGASAASSSRLIARLLFVPQVRSKTLGTHAGKRVNAICVEVPAGRPLTAAPPLAKATHPPGKPTMTSTAAPPEQAKIRRLANAIRGLVHGCGGSGQIRPSRPAHGHGRCRHRAVLPFPEIRSRRSRTGPTATASCCRRAMARCCSIRCSI